MKKNIFTFICIFLISLNLFSDAKDDFLKDVFGSFNDIVDTFAEDYSKITGLYAAGGELKGAASIGGFPSFRFGATLGTIFFTNPIKFLKMINFYQSDWQQIKGKIDSLGMGEAVDWFDNNFLPIPVSNYHFHIGLPKGMNVGGNFNIGPIGAIIKAASPELASSFNPDILHWGFGLNFTYTILREYKYFPTISIGTGFNYSDSKMGFLNIPMGNLNLDESNDSIPAHVGFTTHSNSASFYFDFSISKRFMFFQPYLSLRFVQTVSHNITKFIIDMDLKDATQQAKDTYSKHVEVSNVSKVSSNNVQTGAIIPVTDFIISTGFEFIINIFRLGMEGSFSMASQTGMVTLGMRFHVEDWKIKKMKSKSGKDSNNSESDL